ncbi:hypothetical protein PBAL39_08559 [Pedobacter sp. BAL39]|nr:hypothetical protein PBAL39_08559 [Pedobacter sp. BAL39]
MFICDKLYCNWKEVFLPDFFDEGMGGEICTDRRGFNCGLYTRYIPAKVDKGLTRG